ncbi:tetratricopeptide repeat protein, partial [candidate division KSB1 bacterium]|nr:tetratricopeptide repeat protein [candidate division KSB1 bacterium]
MEQNLKKEIKFLEKRISKEKGSILFARLADTRLKNDELEKAIEICEQGLQDHPYYISGRLVMAKCYLEASMKEQAREELYRILTFDPYNIVANTLMGKIYSGAGDSASAEEHLSNLIQAYP